MISPLPRSYPLSYRLLLAVSLFAASLPTLAQITAAPSAAVPASITGRVLNQSTDRYVNNARVAVKGTALQTFTDESGAYQLDGVAPGTVTVVVSFTNTAPAEKALTLAPGQHAELDLVLAATDSGVVRLDEFRVNAARETDAE